MTRRWTTSDILSQAPLRRPGYAAAFFAAARLDPHGCWVLSDKAFRQLRDRYAPITGLGDLLWLILHPIARALDLATIALSAKVGRRFKTRLACCHACARRRIWLNKLLPFRRR